MHPKPLVFLHVPKTGGTTMNYILNDIYKWRFLWLRNDIIEQESNYLHPVDLFNRIPSHKLKQFSAFSGHQISPIIDALPSEFGLFLLARNPLNQIPSLYQHHLRNISNSPPNLEVRSYKTLLEFVKSQSDYYPNPQVQSLFPKDQTFPNNHASAREKIEELVHKHIDICGITEEFEDFLGIASASLNWPKFSYKVMNQRPDKNADLSDQVKNEILKNNELDFYLYDLVTNKFRSLQQQLEPSSNFDHSNSISFLNRAINRMQQHRLAHLAEFKLKKEVHFKSSIKRLISSRS